MNLFQIFYHKNTTIDDLINKNIFYCDTSKLERGS